MSDGRCRVLVLLPIFMTVANSYFIQKPIDTEVRVGEQTYLNCSTSDASTKISWYHTPIEGHETRVYKANHLFEPYSKRFRIETSSAGEVNLVVTQAEIQDAGSYACQEENGPLAIAQLIVLGSLPVCMSNVNSSVGHIGPNSCGLQKETIQLSCGANYSGNVPPKLQWTQVKGSSSFSIPESCKVSVGRIVCIYTTEASVELDGAHFVCHSTRSRYDQKKCKTEHVKILYAMAENTPMIKTVGETVTCSADTSSISCHYTWMYSDGVEETEVFRNEPVTFAENGWYRCMANCTIKDQQCSFEAMTIYTETDVSYLYGIIVILCIIIALFIALVLVVYFKRKGKNRRYNEMAKMNPLLNKQGKTKRKELLESFRRRELEMDGMAFQSCKGSMKYKEKLTLDHDIETKASQKSKSLIYGIAILDDELFTISRGCKDFEVYSLKDLKNGPKQLCQVEDLVNPKNIVACVTNMCLYIEDKKQGLPFTNEIIRVKPNGEVLNRWSIKKDIGRISVTDESNVIVTIREDNALREYTSRGQLVREIKVDPKPEGDKVHESKINHLRHAILLKSGHFVVCHGDDKDKVHRIFIISRHGDVIKAFGDDEIDPKKKITNPQYLATDSDGSIFLADHNRVLLFSPKLEYERELLSNEDGLWSTFRVLVDMKRGFVLVADNKHTHELIRAIGKVLIFSAFNFDKQLNSSSCYASA